jgi:hypothetical protein
VELAALVLQIKVLLAGGLRLKPLVVVVGQRRLVRMQLVAQVGMAVTVWHLQSQAHLLLGLEVVAVLVELLVTEELEVVEMLAQYQALQQ